MKKIGTLRRNRQQPMLVFVEHDLRSLCDKIRLAHFPALSKSPQVRFVQKGSLANIISLGQQRWILCLHTILNSSETPLYVFSYILKHEMLHTAIRPREIDGHRVAHPPGFFEKEALISPETEEAKRWIFQTLGNRLRVRPRLERIDVLRG